MLPTIEPLELRCTPVGITNPFLNFPGPVQTLYADINNDGVVDVVCGAGKGGGPEVKAFNGKNGDLIADFFAFDPGFTGGVSLAVADINNDGFEDIVVGAGPGGGPELRIFNSKDLSIIDRFFAYGSNFVGGIFVAASDFNGDGVQDIFTGPGYGGAAEIRIFDGVTHKVDFIYLLRVADNLGVSQADVSLEAYKLYTPLLVSPLDVRKNIINYNVADISFAVYNESLLPESVVKLFLEKGEHLVILNGDAVTDYPPFSIYANVVPQGHAETFSFIPGATTTDGLTSVVVLNRWNVSGSVNLILHELGHAFHNLSGGGVAATWEELWNTNSILQSSYTNSSEAFAESFAIYLNGPLYRLSLPYQIQVYFHNVLN